MIHHLEYMANEFWRRRSDLDSAMEELYSLLQHYRADPWVTPSIGLQLVLGLNTNDPVRDPGIIDSFPDSVENFTLLAELSMMDVDELEQVTEQEPPLDQKSSPFHEKLGRSQIYLKTVDLEDLAEGEIDSEMDDWSYEERCWHALYIEHRDCYRALMERFVGRPPDTREIQIHPITKMPIYRLSCIIDWLTKNGSPTALELVEHHSSLPQSVLGALRAENTIPTTLLPKISELLVNGLIAKHNQNPDALAFEIESILAPILDETNITAKIIMKKLRSRVGAPDSCVIGDKENRIAWIDFDGSQKEATMKSLDSKLKRRKDGIREYALRSNPAP